MRSVRLFGFLIPAPAVQQQHRAETQRDHRARDGGCGLEAQAVGVEVSLLLVKVTLSSEVYALKAWRPE